MILKRFAKHVASVTDPTFITKLTPSFGTHGRVLPPFGSTIHLQVYSRPPTRQPRQTLCSHSTQDIYTPKKWQDAGCEAVSITRQRTHSFEMQCTPLPRQPRERDSKVSAAPRQTQNLYDQTGPSGLDLAGWNGLPPDWAGLPSWLD